MNHCKDCRHIKLARTPDSGMHLAECELTTTEHPVTGIKKGKLAFDERISNYASDCGMEGKNFAPKLEVA